jgi:hypothetical protein
MAPALRALSQEYVGRERAFCGGIISGGGKFQSEKQYHSLVGLKSEPPSSAHSPLTFL